MVWRSWLVGLCALAFLFVGGCDDSSESDGDGDADVDGDTDSDGDVDSDGDIDGDVDGDGDSDVDSDVDGDADGDTPIDPSCTSVRLTYYDASNGGWCEFDRTLPMLPSFVRSGMTTAIAEPWAGGSYDGSFGQACGECWEVATSFGAQIVMVHDLCPIEGNPLCAGAHFHFDLSEESASVLGDQGLIEGAARAVPCPVEGNIHVSISNWNQWGYLRAAFVNHRVPILSADIRMAPDGPWIPFERSGGAWNVVDGPSFADGSGAGVSFRFTSAEGAVVTSSTVVPFRETSTELGNAPHVVELDVQLELQADPPDGECEYVPPALVYGDEWGGIDQIRWQPNPWDGVSITETSDGCWNDSASCLRVDGLGSWRGFHIAYWQGFRADAFERLSFWARTLEGSTQFDIGPSHEGERCGEQVASITTEWSQVSIDFATGCASSEFLSAITAQSGEDPVPILLDEILFE